ncbi:PilN domain-containing protein [Halomonas halocynthiae]|uniref:PilN domain-containing protein n=1 Tax=Halomonas halocynthiae TaxID=176290 RepID=UPI0003FCEDF5|nr:PilN domain-containing protein [Halomonas halocynthiae]
MTIEINLLPWRERHRQYCNRRFRVGVLLAVSVGFCLGFSVFLFYGQKLSVQQQRLDYIAQQAAVLDRTLADVEQYDAHIALRLQQLAVLQSLKRQRLVTVAVLNALAASLQDDVHYSSLERQGERLTLSAVALGDSGVSGQLRALGAEPVFAEPEFSALQVTAEGRHFTLTVDQQMPMPEREP